jgi:gas vesicle protein
VDGVNAGVPIIEQAVDVTGDGTGAAQANAAERLSFVQRLMDKLYTLEVDGEKKRQKAILQAQIDGNQERMLQYENDYSEQGISIKSSLAAMQRGLYDQLNAIGEVESKKPKKLDILELLGVAPEHREEVRTAMNNVADAVVSGLTQIYQSQQQQAENRAANATTAISELSSQLQAEVALRKEGSASNIATLREQIQEQKKIRAEAVKEQRKAAQAQVLIDTLTQGSSVATAAAQALAALTPLGPFGFLLGIAAATTIVGAFAAAKVKAYQAAGKSGNDAGGSFFKGGYTGDGDKHEESTRLGQKSYTYHNKEFVMNNELTTQYRHVLLEPLHFGKPELIDWQAPQMQALLPDLELPKQLQVERQTLAEQKVIHQFAPLEAKLGRLEAQLAAIEQHTGTTATKRDVVATADGYMTVDQQSRSTARVRFEHEDASS